MSENRGARFLVGDSILAMVWEGQEQNARALLAKCKGRARPRCKKCGRAIRGIYHAQGSHHKGSTP